MAYIATSLMYLNVYLRVRAYPGSSVSVYNIHVASYPGVNSGGEGRRKRIPGTQCLRMRLIKSPLCDDNVFVWVGFCS